MEKKEIKQTVLDYINRNDSVSYAELEWLFEQKGYDYKGEDVYKRQVDGMVALLPTDIHWKITS